MGNYIQKLFACAVLLLPSCFQAQSTFGYPCVVNEDCDSTQLCVEGVCESGFGVAECTQACAHRLCSCAPSSVLFTIFVLGL